MSTWIIIAIILILHTAIMTAMAIINWRLHQVKAMPQETAEQRAARLIITCTQPGTHCKRCEARALCTIKYESQDEDEYNAAFRYYPKRRDNPPQRTHKKRVGTGRRKR